MLRIICEFYLRFCRYYMIQMSSVMCILRKKKTCNFHGKIPKITPSSSISPAPSFTGRKRNHFIVLNVSSCSLLLFICLFIYCCKYSRIVSGLPGWYFLKLILRPVIKNNKTCWFQLRTNFWLGSTWDYAPQLPSREHLFQEQEKLWAKVGSQFQKDSSYLWLFPYWRV